VNSITQLSCLVGIILVVRQRPTISDVCRRSLQQLKHKHLSSFFKILKLIICFAVASWSSLVQSYDLATCTERLELISHIDIPINPIADNLIYLSIQVWFMLYGFVNNYTWSFIRGDVLITCTWRRINERMSINYGWSHAVSMGDRRQTNGRLAWIHFTSTSIGRYTYWITFWYCARRILTVEPKMKIGGQNLVPRLVTLHAPTPAHSEFGKSEINLQNNDFLERYCGCFVCASVSVSTIEVDSLPAFYGHLLLGNCKMDEIIIKPVSTCVNE